MSDFKKRLKGLLVAKENPKPLINDTPAPPRPPKPPTGYQKAGCTCHYYAKEWYWNAKLNAWLWSTNKKAGQIPVPSKDLCVGPDDYYYLRTEVSSPGYPRAI